MTSIQTTLTQFGFYSITQQEHIASQTREASESFTEASIGIPYRNDGEGRGAHYDHYTTQKTTEVGTTILSAPDVTLSPLKYTRKQATHNLISEPLQGDANDIAKINFGLLYIPGISRKSYESSERESREKFQATLIKEALLTGRPILAVCGGCWQLWEHLGGETKEVKDHNYRGGMPRIKDTTGKVGNNKQVHRIAFTTSAALLKGAMKADGSETPSVNSVHWRAPSEGLVERVEVSALSLADETIAPHVSTEGVLRSLDPEECIEAFESTFGAPILGLQWHPEAYREEDSPHVHILKYMSEAGKAFQIKRKMIQELKTRFDEAPDMTPMKRHALKQVRQGRKLLLKKRERVTYEVKSHREIVYDHLFETAKKTHSPLPPKKRKRHSKPIAGA